MRWRNKSPQLVEAVQRLLTDGTVIDVRVRLESQPKINLIGGCLAQRLGTEVAYLLLTQQSRV